jgi:hypothetical protein
VCFEICSRSGAITHMAGLWPGHAEDGALLSRLYRVTTTVVPTPTRP